MAKVNKTKGHPLTGTPAKEIADLIDEKEITPFDALMYLKNKKKQTQQTRVLISLIENDCPIGRFRIMHNDILREYFDKRKAYFDRLRSDGRLGPKPADDSEDVAARIKNLTEKLAAEAETA